jgi:ribose transport system permease protein
VSFQVSTWVPVRTALSRARYAGFATVLGAVLLVANVLLDHNLVTTSGSLQTFSALAPLALLAIAVTPSLLSGHGGIDLSLGPLAGFCTVLIGTYLNAGVLGEQYVVIPAALVMGLGLGLLNGLIVTVGRIQPIVATLGTYLVMVGLADHYQPGSGGTVPAWLGNISGSIVDVAIVAAVVAGWVAMKRTQFFRWLLAVGRDDRTAYTSGISVTAVRTAAYAIGGLIAGVAGLEMTALISASDSTIGPSYTLTSVAAAALGGTSLAGGAGGILGSFVGALDIFLIENLLTLANVSVFALDLVYGAVLVFAVIVNALVSREGLAVLRAYLPLPERGLGEGASVT